jgi:hypothetical protein
MDIRELPLKSFLKQAVLGMIQTLSARMRHNGLPRHRDPLAGLDPQWIQALRSAQKQDRSILFGFSAH